MNSSKTTKSSFPMDKLPDLVIGTIAKHLSNRDVAACCAVSRGMRAAFDVQYVWGYRYNKSVADFVASAHNVVREISSGVILFIIIPSLFSGQINWCVSYLKKVTLYYYKVAYDLCFTSCLFVYN